MNFMLTILKPVKGRGLVSALLKERSRNITKAWNPV